MSKTVLVAAANGNVGQHIVNRLLIAGHTVRAGSRRGAGSVTLDYTDPTTFGPALEEVDAVYLVVPTAVADATALLAPLIEAATKRGTKLVLQSALGVDANESIPLRQVERRIEASGNPYVVLRPNWFLDNFHGRWFTDITQNQTIAVPAGTAKVSFVDARDIADVATLALTEPTWDGRALTLTGPDSIGYDDAAVALSAIMNRPLTYRAVSDQEFISRADAMGLSAAFVQQMVPIFFPVRQGWVSAVSPDVPAVTQRPARRPIDYFVDNAWRFRRERALPLSLPTAAR